MANLRDVSSHMVYVPTTRVISSISKRGPYGPNELYEDVIVRILNVDRTDVILLDAKEQHLCRILVADWDGKYERRFANVLKMNNLAKDAKGNLIRLSAGQEEKKPEGQTEPPVIPPEDKKPEGGEEVQTPEGDVPPVLPPEDNGEDQSPDVNTENTQAGNNQQNKNQYQGKNQGKNR